MFLSCKEQTSRRQIRAKKYTSFDFLDKQQLIIHIYTIYSYIQEIKTFKIHYACVGTKVTFTIKGNNKLSNWMKTEPTTVEIGLTTFFHLYLNHHGNLVTSGKIIKVRLSLCFQPQ